jgi:hypothetical protein
MNVSLRDLFTIIFEDIIFDNENTEIDDDDDDDYSDGDLIIIVATLSAVFK